MNDQLVSTERAAELLGVKPATIYTYVSRGRLHSMRQPGDPSSWFKISEVESLQSRSRPIHNSPSTDEGLTTAISSIEGSAFFYRDKDPETLMDEYSFEQVAEFLWTGSFPDGQDWANVPSPSAGVVAASALDPDALPLDRLRVAVATMAATDHLRFGREQEALVITARQLMVDLVASLPRIGPQPSSNRIAAQLWARLSDQESSAATLQALESTLIVVADHGVAPSTLAARIAASYRADLYGSVETGIAILAGAWHGGRALSAENMLEEIEHVGDAKVVVGELFRQGGIPCLGQPRYEAQDPRTGMISRIIAVADPSAQALEALNELTQITRERALPAPSFELALAALARAFGLVKGSSEAIFAIGRTAGWIAHAMEVHEQPTAPAPIFTYEKGT